MAPRPTWKGYLRLSLVSCPVRVYSAIARGEKVAFNLLHKDTRNRIRMKPHDPELGAVKRSDLVKGYQRERGEYVIFTEEDLEKVQIESSRAIVIEEFVDSGEVDPIYFEWPYYVAPDGAMAEETFRVIHWAMREKQKAALARFVLSNRERLIALMCRDRGFLMMTMRVANQVRSHQAFFADITEEPPDPEMLELAKRLIAQKSGRFDPCKFRDRYRAAVIEMAEAKVKGHEPVLAKAPERGKVINLMDALKRSLEEARPAAESKPRQATSPKAEPVAGEARKRRKAS
jgi:DNA end-binding protein Ku